MTKFYETVIDVLKQDNRFFTDDGVLLRNAVYEAAMRMDENLISMSKMVDLVCHRMTLLFLLIYVSI